MAYKDSLFRSIFGNAKSALALYNAVHGTSLDPRDTEVVMNTLSETLWTPRKNDLSFLINRSLVVVAEHQSTINENMPYRMLQYVCRLFENGLENKKAVYTDSFERVAGFDGVTLELEIDVYNVNAGRNSSILEACAELKGYAFFVSRVGAHEKELGAQGAGSGGAERTAERTIKAIRLAIQDCKNAGLLREFWENMSKEELNMLASEWDMETALEVSREEGFERGVGVGVETVAVNALAKGLPFELIHELTGLDTETITGLSQRPADMLSHGN